MNNYRQLYNVHEMRQDTIFDKRLKVRLLCFLILSLEQLNMPHVFTREHELGPDNMQANLRT